ncbi:MAG: polyprenyl synthetase family protein [Thaumarchaeota archaeon]|nr:polyprenyl synthetase family protein [Nitrososphaerota archaeon]
MGEKSPVFVGESETKVRAYVQRINLALTRELDLYIESRFHDPLVYAIEGGKRVRPLILLLSAEALGCTDDKLLDAAVAVELLHSESIIHDDIIDEDVTRRGRMTFHIKYGYSASLLTADFVFAMILAIAARYKDRRISDAISNAALNMAEGEYSEVTIDPKAYKLTWDEYVRVISEKTATLFQASSRLGALIAGGSDKEVDALTTYGRYLGIAYQLRDDLLDWGSEDKITKGLLHGSNEAEVVTKVTKLSEMYAERAKTQLSVIPESEAKTLLVELTRFTIKRSY